MSAIDQNFRWTRAKTYRLEPIEWLETLTARDAPVIQKFEVEYSDAFQTRMDTMMPAHPPTGSGLKRIREFERVWREKSSAAFDEVFAQIKRDFQEPQEVTVAKRRTDKIEKELRRYHRKLEKGVPVEPWEKCVVVAEGTGNEYSPLKANLAEILLSVMKRYKNTDGYIQDSALLFCRSYGDLVHPGPIDHEPQWFTLHHWQRTIDLLEVWQNIELVRQADKFDNDVVVGAVEVVLRDSLTRRRPTIVLRPDILLALVGVQFAQLAAGGAKLSNCQSCGRPFFHGSGSGRREGALYCDEVCREKHKTRRRAEARRAVKSMPVKKKRNR